MHPLSSPKLLLCIRREFLATTKGYNMTVAPWVGTSYPITCKSSPGVGASPTTQNQATEERFLAAARRGQHGVRAPRRWRDELDVADYAVLVVLLSMRTGRQRSVTVGQRTIAGKLGRDGSRTDHVGRVVQRLVDAGAIATRRTARGTGVTRYELLDLEGRYDVIPWVLLRALEAGECTAGEVRTYAYVADAMGARGWTSDTAAEIAHVAGVSARTIRRHVDRLEDLGVLRVRTVPAAVGLWLLERVDHQPAGRTQEASSTAEEQGEDEVVLAGEEVLVDELEDVVDRELPQASDLDTDVGWSDTDVGSIDLTPDSLTPEDTPASLVVDRQVSKRERGVTSGLRPKGGVFSGPGCAEVLTGLSGTAWRAPESRRWLGGVLGQAVTPALAAGMSPAAVVHALVDRGEDELLERASGHIGIARQAISEVRLDIRLGQACRQCGRMADQDGLGLVNGAHEICPTGRDERHHDGPGSLSVEQRIASYQSLQMTPEAIAQIDPEAAAVLASTGDLVGAER